MEFTYKNISDSKLGYKKYAEDLTNLKCDKYDYLIAGCSGVFSGIIDIFFVGKPGSSKLGNFTDIQTDNLVKRFAKLVGWKPKDGNEDSVSSAINYFERNFSINYDQANSTKVGGDFNMGTTNHHFKSLGHSPDIVGLFFSILDQFQGKASFFDNGQLIRIESNNPNFKLQGNNFISKLFCGFCNWIGHLISDVAGSSGGRRSSSGRGSGIPIPFMNLFQLCNFGEFKVGEDRNTLAMVMTKVFQQGYDARFGAAMAIPVLINELMIRTLWVIKKRFFEKRDWKYCVPSEKYADLRLMLLVGYGALCLVDGAHAGIRSGGNVVSFVLRLNIIAWARLIILIFKELKIRYGGQITTLLKTFFNEVFALLSHDERELLYEYNARMSLLDEELKVSLLNFKEMIDKEYEVFYQLLELTFDEGVEPNKRLENSAEMAKIIGVSEGNICKNRNDVRRRLMGY